MTDGTERPPEQRRSPHRERKLASLRREWQFQAVGLMVLWSALAAWTFPRNYWQGVGQLATMIILEVAAYLIYERRRRALEHRHGPKAKPRRAGRGASHPHNDDEREGRPLFPNKEHPPASG